VGRRLTAPRLSRYLHFGHIGPHTVMRAMQEAKAPPSAKDDDVDELLTWRALAINFVHFNALYDSLESAPDWADKRAGGTRPASETGPLVARAVGVGRDDRRSVECRAASNASRGVDAQLHADVLGEEGS
jgi:hypothetical protein